MPEGDCGLPDRHLRSPSQPKVVVARIIIAARPPIWRVAHERQRVDPTPPGLAARPTVRNFSSKATSPPLTFHPPRTRLRGRSRQPPFHTAAPCLCDANNNNNNNALSKSTPADAPRSTAAAPRARCPPAAFAPRPASRTTPISSRQAGQPATHAPQLTHPIHQSSTAKQTGRQTPESHARRLVPYPHHTAKCY